MAIPSTSQMSPSTRRTWNSLSSGYRRDFGQFLNRWFFEAQAEHPAARAPDTSRSLHVLPCNGADIHHRQDHVCLNLLLDSRPNFLGVGQIHLVEHDNLRAFGQLRVEEHKFLIDGLKISEWIRAVTVQEMD